MDREPAAPDLHDGEFLGVDLDLPRRATLRLATVRGEPYRLVLEDVERFGCGEFGMQNVLLAVEVSPADADGGRFRIVGTAAVGASFEAVCGACAWLREGDAAPGPRDRYAHTNVVAADWRRLRDFYVDVLGCTPVGVERDHHGPWIEEVTSIPGARIRGAHVRLPGHGLDGPTLELFTYDENAPRPDPGPGGGLSRPGFAHLAFEVADLEATTRRVLEAGGSRVGARRTREVPGEGTITLVYLTDPEGNVVELQQWRRDAAPG